MLFIFFCKCKMNRVKRFVILVFAMTLLTAEVSSNSYVEFRDNAMEYGIASKVIGQNFSRVYINDKAYEIYVFDTDVDQPLRTRTVRLDESERAHTVGFYENTVHKLYTCVNCRFAEWTLAELVRLLEQFPTLYQRKFHPDHGDAHATLCEGERLAFANLVERVQRFANLLLNFQRIFLSRRDTSADTDVLSALLSWVFKARALSASCDDRAASADRSDVAVIRAVLASLNSFQNYVYVNCKQPPSSDDQDSRQLYGFFVNNTDVTDAETFLADIAPLNLEPAGDVGCRATQMLLDDAIGRRFDRVRWTTEHGETTMKNVVQKIKTSHDPPVVFWYQTRVFETIMKMLFTKIAVHYEQNRRYLSDDDVRDLKSVHSMLTDHVDLPQELNECFALVTLATETDEFTDDHELLVTKITAFTSSLNTVDLGELENLIPDPNSDDSEGPSIHTAQEFIAYLKHIGEDLKCFMKLFAYFRNKRDIAYYMPFADDSMQMQTFEREISSRRSNGNQHLLSLTDTRDHRNNGKDVQQINDVLNDDGCTFFGDLYHVFFIISVDLNLVHSSKHFTDYLDISRLNIYSRIEKNIKTITDVLKSFTSNNSYHPHFKTILNILPLIVFKNSTFFAEQNCADMKRMVYVIMNKLNDYNIEHCNPPKHNFLFFNNIQFQSIGRVKMVHEEIVSVFDTMKKTNDIYFSKHTFKNSKESFFAITSHDLFPKYDKFIQMNWKGGIMNLGRIFLALTSSIVSAFDLFAFHDYSFKFCFAMLFIETHKYVQGTKTHKTKTQKIFLDFFNVHKFPKKFENVVHSLQKYADTHINRNLPVTGDSANIVYNAFDNVGVYFENIEKTEQIDGNKKQERIGEIMSLLATVNKEFLSMSYGQDWTAN